MAFPFPCIHWIVDVYPDSGTLSDLMMLVHAYFHLTVKQSTAQNFCT